MYNHRPSSLNQSDFIMLAIYKSRVEQGLAGCGVSWCHPVTCSGSPGWSWRVQEGFTCLWSYWSAAWGAQQGPWSQLGLSPPWVPGLSRMVSLAGASDCFSTQGSRVSVLRIQRRATNLLALFQKLPRVAHAAFFRLHRTSSCSWWERTVWLHEYWQAWLLRRLQDKPWQRKTVFLPGVFFCICVPTNGYSSVGHVSKMCYCKKMLKKNTTESSHGVTWNFLKMHPGIEIG